MQITNARPSCVIFSPITITATTDGTTQAHVPAGASVTQQLIYHTPVGVAFLMESLDLNALKISGGGGSPRVTFELRTFSRVTGLSYLLHSTELDTAVSNHETEFWTSPLKITGKEVVYVMVATDVNNTKVTGRLTGVQHKV